MDELDTIQKAHDLLQDALHIFNALVTISHPQLKTTLRNAALSAAEMAVATLKGELCSCDSDVLGDERQMDISAIPHIQDPPLYPSRYTEFIAMIMPAIRNAYPERAQQENITHAAQLWHRHKHMTELASVLTHARQDVEKEGEGGRESA